MIGERHSPARIFLLLLALLLSLGGCSLVSSNPGRDSQDPDLSRRLRVFSSGSSVEVSLTELFDRLSETDVVFVGETHLDEVTHRLELAIARALKQRHSKIVISMEMFERDVQDQLDSYLAGEISEAQFLATSRPWSNYVTGYRPLIEWAREEGVPVVAANLPSPLRRKLMFGGKEALDALTLEERRGIATEILPATDRYWQRFDSAVRGHGHIAQPGSDRRFSTQNLWDNTMGESVAHALDEHPGALIIHYAGAFHTLERDGTARQFLLRRPSAGIKTVHIVPTSDLVNAQPEVDDERADFIVAAEALSRGYQDGTLAVMASREVRYRLSLGGASGACPLLIWLGQGSLPAADELVRLRAELGDVPTIVAVEAIYPQVEEDLHLGGRWFWDSTFNSDLQMLGSALARLRETLLRQHNVDPQRLLLAGEGDGATVVAAVALGDEDWPRSLAISPSGHERLGESGLPAPDADDSPVDWGPGLTVISTNTTGEWWRGELAAWQGLRVPCRWRELSEDPLESQGLRDSLLLENLQLTRAPAGDEKSLLWTPTDSPLAGQWARITAARWREQGEFGISWAPEPPAAALRLAVSGNGSLWGPEDFLDPQLIPFPDNPFGGTVILVVGADSSPQVIARWQRLEEEDVTRKRSRFVGTRVAVSGSERDLPAILEELREENKSVVLVVPTRFCATADEMSELKASIEGFDQGLRIGWLPGLGGMLARKASFPDD